MKIWVDGEPQTIRNPVTILGRDPTADVAVLHAEVSRKHACVIALGDGRFVLMDFKSANGTRLNGRKIETAELRDGDQIQLGDVTLTVESETRRAGSLAATGYYKRLLDLDAAQATESSTGLDDLWTRRFEGFSRLLPHLVALRGVGDLDEAAAGLLAAGIAGLASDRGLLLLLDEDGKALRLRAERGYPRGEGLRKNLHQALLDEAIDNDRVVSTRPGFMEQVFARMGGAQAVIPDVGSAVAAPVSICGVRVAALYLERRRTAAEYRPEDLAVLRFLAQYAGPILAGLLLEKQMAERLSQVCIEEVVLAARGLGNCEICGEGLGAEARVVVSCRRCRTPHHEDCWNFLGRCSIYGCAGTEHQLGLGSASRAG